MLVALAVSAVACATNPIPIPTDSFPLPPPPDPVKIRNGDVLEVRIWSGYKAETIDTNVQEDGKIALPYVNVSVQDTTVLEARDRIQEALKKFFKTPRIDLVVKQSKKAGRIHVFGEVRSPQTVPWQPGMTVVDALGAVGGWGQDARLHEAVVIRGGMESPQVFRTDLDRFFRTADPRENFALRDGDVLYIPRSRMGDIAIAVGRVKTIIEGINIPIQQYLLFRSLQPTTATTP